jgi:hypothetical protein
VYVQNNITIQSLHANCVVDQATSEIIYKNLRAKEKGRFTNSESREQGKAFRVGEEGGVFGFCFLDNSRYSSLYGRCRHLRGEGGFYLDRPVSGMERSLLCLCCCLCFVGLPV